MKYLKNPAPGFFDYLDRYLRFDSRSIAVFRIFLGLSTWNNVLNIIFIERFLLWGDFGFDGGAFINVYYPFTPTLHWIPLIIHACASMCLIFGVQTHITTTVLWILEFSLSSTVGGNGVVKRNLLLLAIDLPLSQKWSVDADDLSEFMKPTLILVFLTTAHALMHFHIGILAMLCIPVLYLNLPNPTFDHNKEYKCYSSRFTLASFKIVLLALYAGGVLFHKSKSKFWINELTAVRNSMDFVLVTDLGLYVKDLLPLFVFKALNVYTLIAELVFPFGILVIVNNPLIKPLCIFGIIALHIGILLLMNIDGFCHVCIGFDLLFLPSTFWDWFLKTNTLWIDSAHPTSQNRQKTIAYIAKNIFFGYIMFSLLVHGLQYDLFPRLDNSLDLWHKYAMFSNPQKNAFHNYSLFVGKTEEGELIDIGKSWMQNSKVNFKIKQTYDVTESIDYQFKTDRLLKSFNNIRNAKNTARLGQYHKFFCKYYDNSINAIATVHVWNSFAGKQTKQYWYLSCENNPNQKDFHWLENQEK